VPVKNAPSYAGEDLGAALKVLHENYGCPACNSRGFTLDGAERVECQVCGGTPNLKLNRDAYVLFRNVADVLVYTKGDVRDRKNVLITKVQQLDQAGMLGTAGAAADFTLFGDSPESGGIFFGGVVQSLSPMGENDVLVIAVEGSLTKKPIKVVTPPGVSVAGGDRVAVLGSAIFDPANEIDGFTGNEPVAVWSTCVTKLD